MLCSIVKIIFESINENRNTSSEDFVTPSITKMLLGNILFLYHI